MTVVPICEVAITSRRLRLTRSDYIYVVLSVFSLSLHAITLLLLRQSPYKHADRRVRRLVQVGTAQYSVATTLSLTPHLSQPLPALLSTPKVITAFTGSAGDEYNSPTPSEFVYLTPRLRVYSQEATSP